MPVTTVADPSKSITVSYELSGEAKETAIVAVAKAEGLDAVIDRDAKTVTVSFDASFSRGTVIVMAYDLADNVIVQPLFYGFGLGTLRRAEGRHGQEPCHRRRLVGRFDRGRDDGRGSRGRICL